MKITTAKILCALSALALFAKVLLVVFSLQTSFKEPIPVTAELFKQQAVQQDQVLKQQNFLFPGIAIETETEEEEKHSPRQLPAFAQDFFRHLLSPAAAAKTQWSLAYTNTSHTLPLYQQHCVYLI